MGRKAKMSAIPLSCRPLGECAVEKGLRGQLCVLTCWEDGAEMVEEYDPMSGALLGPAKSTPIYIPRCGALSHGYLGAVRKTRHPSKVGAKGAWTFEIGEDPGRREAQGVAGMMAVSSSNPIFLRFDQPTLFEWRVRNIMWPAEVYLMAVEGTEVVIRTTNKKYYKRFVIDEMVALGLALNEADLSWTYANNTLVIQYTKPAKVVEFEQEKAKARLMLVAKATEGRGFEALPVAGRER